MSIQAIQRQVAEYFKNQPIQKAWLFGSYARGEETPLSNVDLLVQYKAEGISLLKHAAMICELEKILGCPVDIVEEGTLLPFATESANRDKKLIYERDAAAY
ncbi:MAG: nucleotidyltransferase domain-containing protein [Bacteroidales bacterium]|nr:nucleotidyltransferase domain-containing protein [Bacteroidales bacterium]